MVNSVKEKNKIVEVAKEQALGMNRQIYKQLNDYKKDIEEKGYEVIYIGLYGSQNYNLHDEQSDIDARAVVMPTLKNILRMKNISKVYKYETGEVDVKDIITFMDNLGKGNPAYIESIETKYSIGDKEFKELAKGYKVNPKAIVGMMHEKRKAIEKGLPKSSPMIEKIGYDPKQLHHIFRLHLLLLQKELKSIYYYTEETKDRMIMLKRDGNGKLEDAMIQSNMLIDDAFEIIKDMEFERTLVNEEVLEYVERHLFNKSFTGNKTITAEQIRTFGGNVPKKHKKMFEELEKLDGTDSTYCIYSYLEILDDGKNK